MQVSYDAEEEKIVKKRPVDENIRVIGDTTLHEKVVNKLNFDEYTVPEADYIEIDFFGQKMTEELFRQTHTLAWNQPTEAFF